MNMGKELKVPKLSNHIRFYSFSANSYFIHQTKYNYRIKISLKVYNIIRKIDGVKSLKDILDELNTISVNLDQLYDLLFVKLSYYGIIENYFIIKPKGKPSYLKLSFIVFPAHLLNRITPVFSILFRNKIHIPIIFISFLIFSYSLYDNITLIGKIDYFLMFPQLLFLSFISVTFHEIGHVTAASFFGAKHGGIGGGFYLLSPVYFADVTDIWKLTPIKRIIVNLSGVYFECIVSAIFVLFGYFFENIPLKLMAIVFVLSMILNLNPFFRRDGYWVLTDYLEIPNLYLKSNQIFYKGLKSLVKKRLYFL